MMNTADHYSKSHNVLFDTIDREEYLRNKPGLWENRELATQLNKGKEILSKGKFYVSEAMLTDDEDERKQKEQAIKSQ